MLTGLQARGAVLAYAGWGSTAGLVELAHVPWDLVVVPADLIGPGSGARAGLVVRGLVDLARSLDLRVLVTGVDRPEDSRSWADLGGDLARGSAHGPARSTYALEAFLQRRTPARPRAAL